MSFIQSKNEYFFPSEVFRRACLGTMIQKCYDKGIFSLVDIVDEISKYSFVEDDINKVFVVKCGDDNKDCIFTCENHLGIILFAKKKFSCTDIPNDANITITYCCGKTETYCTGCIRHYLKIMYHYFYFVNFDLKICLVK